MITKLVPEAKSEKQCCTYIYQTTFFLLITYLFQAAGNRQAGYGSVPPVPQFEYPKAAICNLVASKDSTGKIPETVNRILQSEIRP
jgi:hypothetical protein